MDDILPVLPPTIREVLHYMPKQLEEKIEEIRVRIGRPLEVIAEGAPIYPSLDGGGPCIVQAVDARFILNQLSQYSLYAFEEELKRGFITLKGGHRVGLAGKVILEKGEVKTLKDISSFNIRIARQMVGSAEQLISSLLSREAGKIVCLLVRLKVGRQPFFVIWPGLLAQVYVQKVLHQ